MTTDQAVNGMEARKARTRAALIEAGQSLLSEGRTAVPVQEITAVAGVGLGSFYNHFETKEDLFAAAVTDALAAHDDLIAAATVHIEDAAELFAVGLRSTGRLQRLQPAMARVLLHEGTGILLHDVGIAARAKADIARGIEQGRFAIGDVELAYMAIGGALLGLIQLLDARPELDAGAMSDLLAENLLRLLGLDEAEAQRIAYGALPDIFTP